jgi:hypothetical protein
MTAKKGPDNIADLLDEEAEAIDADRDAPIVGSTVTRGRGRSKTLQIRLNPEELEELERIAESRGLPTSTVAREAILDLLDPAQARSALVGRLTSDFTRYLNTLAHGALPGDLSPVNALPVNVSWSAAADEVTRSLLLYCAEDSNWINRANWINRVNAEMVQAQMSISEQMATMIKQFEGALGLVGSKTTTDHDEEHVADITPRPDPC